MFRVEVHSESVKTREGTSQRTGKEYRIREQSMFVYLNGEPYPQKMVLNLGDSQRPYPPGDYDLVPEFFVGNFGDLRIGMRDAVLTPVDDKKKATA